MLPFLALKITEKVRINSFGNARLSKAGRKCGLGGPVLRQEDDARGLGWKGQSSSRRQGCFCGGVAGATVAV